MKINTVYVENDIKNNTNTLNILQRIGFNEIKSEWQDGKARNPVTGTDE